MERKQVGMADYWNHNVHYNRVILEAVPHGCGRALDVGCGDGRLVGELVGRCRKVIGIDRDQAMIALARSRVTGTQFVLGDFMTHAFAPESFDFVCANTSLHHMGSAVALRKMAEILRPGGRLAVVGLADNGSPLDWAIGAAGIPANLLYRKRYGERNSGAPIRHPDQTWAQTRRTARSLLLGVRYRRHLLWRFSLIWTKPGLDHSGRR